MKILFLFSYLLILVNLIFESQEDNISWKINNQVRAKSKRVKRSKWLSIKGKDIDKILKVPNCGEISNKAASRVINAKESETWYPWMSFISRYEPNYLLPDDESNGGDIDLGGDLRSDRVPKKDEEFLVRRSTCTGSIISSRTILTAAHCICYSRNKRKYLREHGIMLEGFTTCKMPFRSKSKPTNRLNQYIPLKNKKGESLKESEIEYMWDNKIKTKSHSFNHIAVKIGSRDFTKGAQQQVKFAYNMYVEIGTTWENEKPDIALVIVKRSMKYPELQVAPICLPSSKDTTNHVKVKQAGWGYNFHHDNWGKESDESLKSIDGATISSCMTSELGNLNHQYEYCNMPHLKLNNYECYKALPPNERKYDEECDNVWQQAKDWANQKDMEWKVDQIHVKKTESDKLICYNKENILKNGWCYTIDGVSSERWGICSESCKYMKNKEREKTSEDFNKVRSTSYHEAQFKLIDRDKVVNSVSSNLEEYKCRQIKGNEDMKDKSACVVDIKPKTMVLTFWLKNPNDMELDTNPKIEEREPVNIGIEAKQYRYRDYIGICYGDSGAAYWKEEPKPTVLAIVSLSPDENKVCAGMSVAHKITHKDILKWISKNWVK